MEHDDIEEVVEPADPNPEPKERLLAKAKIVLPECVAKGSRLTMGSPGRALFATRCLSVRNRPQPIATIRDRSQPFATVCRRSRTVGR